MPDYLTKLSNVTWQQSGNSVLQDISMTIHAGEIVTLIGPNGAGKSSLVNLIVGLLEPTRGEVRRRPRLRIGYMPQHLRFDGTLPLSVRGFLQLAGDDREALSRSSSRLGIGHLLDSQLQTLSGGEMQRVLLTRALLRRPELLVLDEPVQGVDIAGQAELYRIISEIKNELGCGVLMVSHDLHLVMAQTDRVVCLNRHICCEGAPENVSKNPEFLQLFGRETATDIAVYTHHHDHEHNLHGDVVDGPSCGHNHDA